MDRRINEKEKYKIVFASDSFKGTLSSEQTAELLNKAAQEVFGDFDAVSVNVADGGEGTIDSIITQLNGRKEYVDVHDPLGNKIQSYYGLIDDNTAIIEMALASGLTLVPVERRNPLYTTSVGTGELVKHALDRGATDIIVAIGGSATNDGGMGFASALGVKFYDCNGKELEGRGENLIKVQDIDASEIVSNASKATFTVMCDVSNPLCGDNGATYVFGKQKGATEEGLQFLERGMQNYSKVIDKTFGIDTEQIVGGGAAGGLGAALKVFFNAIMKSGIDTVLDIIGFDDCIKGADYIITGEGRADSQSASGKVVQGIARHGRRMGIPVIALCGSLGSGYEMLYEDGVSLFISISNDDNIETVLSEPEKYYYLKALELFKRIKER